MALARAVTLKIKRAVLHHVHAPTVYDPEAERGYAEQVLREQMEEWSREDGEMQDQSFSYGSVAGFDPQP